MGNVSHLSNMLYRYSKIVCTPLPFNSVPLAPQSRVQWLLKDMRLLPCTGTYVVTTVMYKLSVRRHGLITGSGL